MAGKRLNFHIVEYPWSKFTNMLLRSVHISNFVIQQIQNVTKILDAGLSVFPVEIYLGGMVVGAHQINGGQ